MMATRLTSEEKKFILKCYWKHENAVEMQRQFRKMFQKEPPIGITISRIRDKFESDGTVENISKNHSGRPCTSTSLTEEEKFLKPFTEVQESLCGKLAVS